MLISFIDQTTLFNKAQNLLLKNKINKLIRWYGVDWVKEKSLLEQFGLHNRLLNRS